MEDFDFVDFADTTNNSKKLTKCYYKDGVPIVYDNATINYYCTLRKTRIDPITGKELDPNLSFEFPYEWDPYTGERKGIDPFGSLWFDPDVLIYTFYKSRLKLLWKNESNDNTGYYQGYYDAGVGAGENFHIESRGDYPETYLFRIPIIDCYLTKDHNESVVTMGPVLTNDELKTVENLANKIKAESYKLRFGKNRPSLTHMKKLYDQAISKSPDISAYVANNKISKLSESELADFRYKANITAVELLKKM